MIDDTNNTRTMSEDSQIILYQPDESIRHEVKLDAEHETVWLTQTQIAELFGIKRPAITKHLGNIFSSGELDRDSVSSIWNILPWTVRSTGLNSIILTPLFQ